MSSSLKNLSEFEGEIPQLPTAKISLVVSEWNIEITGALKDGAVQSLLDGGLSRENIQIYFVPGTYELALGAKWEAVKNDVDAVICLGCVIQGETKHFDFICQAAANGIMNVGIESGKPVVFGVLTTDNLAQAQDRSGGKHGNKGYEAGITALKMLQLKN